MVRTVAVCLVGNEDINRWMTFQGWALAYRKYSGDYVDAEDEARVAGRGLWRGGFEPPWIGGRNIRVAKAHLERNGEQRVRADAFSRRPVRSLPG